MTVENSRSIHSFVSGNFARFLILELISGVVVSTLSIAYAVGFSALIFNGPIAAGMSTGLWSLLVGTAISSAVVGFFTSIPPLATNAESTTISMLKVLSLSVVANVAERGGGGEQMVTDVCAAIILATIVSGIAQYVVGAARLGQYLRFVPSAVTGGFLGATGLLVLIASLKLATGYDVTDVLHAIRSEPAVLWKLVVALAFFFAFQVARQVTKSPLILPLGFMGLSAVVFVASRLLPHHALFAGWFPSGVTEMRPWFPLSPRSLSAIDWGIMLESAPEIIAMCVVLVVTLVVRTSGIEVSLRKRADFDAEFRAHGAAGVLSGLLGGTACAAAAGTSRLQIDLGSTSRLSAYVVSVGIFVVLLAGIDLTALFAQPLLGGLLIVVGWTLAAQAIVPPIRQRAWGDVAVILTIVLVALRIGFAAATAAGFAFSCFMFALSYSRVGVVRRHLTRATFASHVARPPALERQLKDDGNRVHIYWLGGYIFFGSADRLYNEIRVQIEQQRNPAVAFGVIDSTAVTGLDTAAVQSFAKLCDFCADRGITIAFAALSQHNQKALATANLFAHKASVRTFADLNQALAWCEEQILPQLGTITEDEATSWLVGEDGFEGDPKRLAGYLEKRVLGAGEPLYVAGSAADTIDFVAQGSVSIVVGNGVGRHEVRRMARRTVLGEMGFFRQQTRSASVIANEPVIAYTLTRSRYELMQHEDPATAQALLVYLIRILSDRLEFANLAITSLVAIPVSDTASFPVEA